MSTEKKAFVLYYDALPCLEALPREQVGDLLLELFRYAQSLETQPDRRPESCQTGLSPEGWVAFLFLAATIRRDTAKWKRTKQAYQDREKRKQEGQEGKHGEMGKGAGIQRESGRKGEEDLSWMRRYIQAPQQAPQ